MTQVAASHSSRRTSIKVWLTTAAALGIFGAGVVFGPEFLAPSAKANAPAAPTVTVSTPAERDVEKRLQLLGQFSAVQQVELRPQVGGTLTKISFKDGDIVREGDVLFEIDPTPYQIKLDEAKARVETARAQLELAIQQLGRADTLKQSGFGTVENADQRLAQKRAAQASLDDAQAAVRDAQFDLDHTRVTAPFTGRIGTHLVSIGNLVAGSRAATSPTTLLATLVSVDNIYLNFDLSESDYATFQQAHLQQQGPLADKVQVSINGGNFDRNGTLDFIDNALDRSSGTIHGRATIKNTDGLLTPGAFARVRIAISKAVPTLLVPDASVLPDQSEHVVLTVGADGTVTPKKVELGDLRDGLRVITSGLTSSDRVVVAGIPIAKPGAKVIAENASKQLASD
ncbi:efflux RND transporter periplasmic adaptor subunit [Bradyrhizobium sp. CB1650]|uniref:efflux RND transporter periplasmic adaptor subunit n=1 Tax=Bradyrhizobium sp. CB1650 TaxID=3039153 RepID=UPI002435A4A0|nr:efflux RND transporter periplasmic adaptor subunit [Bradyrhizobium sp. CB1650]WGD55514.1 efflux RND transporter periplasmic adaptor subunit [Bradyrhizobium sp. CB1650]